MATKRRHYPGTYVGYLWHLEQRKADPEHKICDGCSADNAAQQASYRKRVYLNGGNLYRPACGVRRRLQALAARGWTMREISRRYGRDYSSLSNMTVRREKKFVFGETHEKISALYDELSMVPPPDGYVSKRQATSSHKRGYLPPLYWDDDTIDDPHGLPSGMLHYDAYKWFWGAASMLERIEWVLEHGLAVTRRYE